MQQSFGRRLLRVLLNVGIAVAVLVSIFYGAPKLWQSDESAASEAQPPPQNLATPVGLMTLEVEDEIIVRRQFLGRIEARQSANLAFEFSGTIENIPVREGGMVRRGDVLASLQTEVLIVERAALLASLAAVQAQFELSRTEAERIEKLVSRGAAQASRLEQVVAQRDTLAARVAEVESAVEQADLRLVKSRLVAPFDGIVGARLSNLGETIGAGETVVSIYEADSADFRVGLPTTLDPRALMNTRIRVNGQEYKVTLRAVRPDIDFRTNTRIVIFEVDTSEPIGFGLSATLIGDVALPMRGAWVPLDAMRPSAEGYWIVLAVDENNVARRVAVEVQHLRTDEAYVIGAFETGTQIIRDGAHKVVPGQSVRAQ